MEALTEQQTATSERILKILVNYKKDGPSRRDQPYLETRIQRLDDEWTKFENTDSELQLFEDENPDHPYFKQNFFSQVKDTYMDIRCTFTKALEDLPKPSAAPRHQQQQPEMDATSELEAQRRLIRQQHATMTALERLLQSTDESMDKVHSQVYYNHKVQSISGYWTTIATLHSEIMAGPDQLDYKDTYYSAMEQHKEDVVIALLEKIENAQFSTTRDSSATSNMKLPKINLPTFDGNYLKWKTFHDLFLQLIHRNSMSLVEKMFYLKAHLTGEAGKLIQHLQVSEQNYSTAWNILVLRYDNKRLLVSAFLQKLLSQPMISTESAAALKRFHDTTNECLLGISNLGVPVDQWDPLLLFILQQKLDRESHRLFEQSLTSPRELQKVDELLKFLEGRFHMLENLGEKRIKPEHKELSHHKTSLVASKKATPCPVCRSSRHLVYTCAKFLQLSPPERIQQVQRLQLCRNCLRTNHSVQTCPSGKCRKCNQLHHTLLHIDQYARATTNQNKESTSSPTSSGPGHSTSLAAHKNKEVAPSYVFLGTAVVQILDKYQCPIECRTLIDSGSQVHFISERFRKRLGLSSSIENLEIATLGTQKSKSQGRVSITMQSMVTNYSTRLEAYVMPQISANQPLTNIDVDAWQVPKNIHLADTKFNTSLPIDLLIGAELFCEIMSIGQIKLGQNLPTLQNTMLGWVVIGKATNIWQPSQFCGISTREDALDRQIERFWTIEESVPERKPLTATERKCEELFESTTIRDKDGRFIVKLPFAYHPSSLGESKDIAVRRFLSLERRLNRSQELKDSYTAFIHEYIHLNHMEAIQPSEIKNPHYFLPHHCVLKPESTTTKLRVVFDASCKTSTNLSLNDILLPGPALQNDIFSILVRFRQPKYVFTADITKMYRQILVNNNDQQFQLIIWRDNQHQSLQYFRLNTVTYGTTAAPYLALKCLQQLAKEGKDTHKLASKIINHECYVDDIMTGSNDLGEALHMQSQLRNLLQSGGFMLRKWCSNHPRLLADIPEGDRETSLKIADQSEQGIKTLGVTWLPTSDRFIIKITLEDCKRITKRTILSDAARVFDPMGFVAPVIVFIKILLKQLWSLKLDWDAALPQEIHTRWLNFRQELKALNTLTLPRHVMASTKPESIQIHAFSDASESAYGAAIYIRSTDSHGNVVTQLLCSKSRVAPTKVTTLPRLELCAAVLAAQLVDRIKPDLTVSGQEFFYWTDSTIVLSWILRPSSSFKTFVANRISSIHELTQPNQWYHVDTKLNPADLVSRGMTPAQLLKSTIWFHGPQFLKTSKDDWPKKPKILNQSSQEDKQVKVSLTVNKEIPFIDRINHKNSFNHLQRTIAFMLRFVNNARTTPGNRRLLSSLSVQELQDALIIIIKELQAKEFQDELKLLQRQRPIESNSRLKTLTPFLDEKGIIRVGGRLQASHLQYDAKHPMVLPSSHIITKLLMIRIHKENLHIGPQGLLAKARQRFWPLRGKQLAQTVVHQCVFCARFQPKNISQIMGNLPVERVQPSRPFTNVGIDFLGPVYIHYKLRGKRPTKTYVAVFVCFSTKAVHLEVVSDLTTAAFIGALKRFIGRRGCPSKIFTDNATNFMGARSELEDLHKLFSNQENQHQISEVCSQRGIEWRPIPPNSPHFGGLWEAAVKSAKGHLKKVLLNASLTYEELSTAVTDIEAILNSRPITQLSSDPNDFNALTPGHFLIGEALTALPDSEAKTKNATLLARWNKVKAIKNEFWRRWSQEYLQDLQNRYKWNHISSDIKPGTLVLLKDKNLPPTKWQLGRVSSAIMGEDGRVRVIDIKTASGTFRRSIHNVCPLPVENDQPTEKVVNQTRKPEVQHCNVTKKSSHSSKSRFLPINPSWNNQDNQDNAEDATNNKRSNRSIGSVKKISRISGALSLLLLTTFILPVFGMTRDPPFEVNSFTDHPGIYFDGCGQLSLALDNWNLIVFYDMNNYWHETGKFQPLITQLNTICNSMTHEIKYCLGTTQHFQGRLEVINHNNIILSTGHGFNDRTKRSPFNIIGTVANKLFGILDQDYAYQLEQTIQNVKVNENHLLQLIKNHTSVIDSTKNIIKKDEEYVNHQFFIINNYMKRIMLEHQSLTNTTAVQVLSVRFNLLTTYLNLILTNYERTQNALVDSVVDTHQGKLSPLLVTPQQLRKQLHIIRENLPSNLRIPGDVKSNNLQQLYKLMTARVQATNNNIIFDVKLPLISREVYELFKIIPIPTRHDQHQISIQPTSKYFAINAHRDQYYTMTDAEFLMCAHLSDEEFLCREAHPIRKNSNSCELSLFTHNEGIPPSCSIIRTPSIQWWHRLSHPNEWLYSLNRTSVTIVCDSRPYQQLLDGEGILKLKAACVIKHSSITITSHPFPPQKFFTSFLPSANITEQSLSNRIILPIPNDILSFNNNSKYWQELQKSIQDLKQQEHLPSTISTHDIHQYSVSYLTVGILAIIICIGAYIKLKHIHTEGQHPRKNTNQRNEPRPIPAPRQHHDSRFDLQEIKAGQDV